MRVMISYDVANDIILTDIINYSISLQSMPKSSNDSSGSVGEFSVEFILPLNASNHLNSRGFEILEGKGVQFESDYGLIYGTINSASLTDRHTLTIQCTSYAGGLNAYNVQARPHWRGTQYRWTGTPGASVSEKVVGGQVVARNLIHNGSFEYVDNDDVPLGWQGSYEFITSFSLSDIGLPSDFYFAPFGGVVGRRAGYADKFSSDTLHITNSVPFPVTAGEWVGVGALLAGQFDVDVRISIRWLDDQDQSVGTLASSAYTLAPFPDGIELFHAAQAPAGATRARILIYSKGTQSGFTTLVVDAVRADTAATETEALNRVLHYFDGDTPENSTLEDALTYYFSLGTESVNVVVDPSIADRTVVYPGWSGELWHHLKLLCAAEDLNFVLTGQGYVYVQPNKTNEVPTSYGTSLSQSVDSSNLAQKVSVREYNCQPVAQALFYPRGGWSEDTEILSVNAGEYTEQVIELGGSIETLQEPQMYEFVDRSWDLSSAYTIVAEDGFPVPEALWTSRGGKISFEINDDYQSITVKMRGANGVPLASGDTATSFSLALAADSGGSSRYSTLRIVGSGVLHDHDKELVVNTGIPESVTGTEIGATIDNPFLFNRERVGRAAALAVREYSGAVLSAQGAATNLGSGFTVDDVGARITVGQRPFRVRSVGYAPEGLNFTAEDDLSHEDMQDALSGMTYGEIETENSGLTYRNVFSRGVRYNGA